MLQSLTCCVSLCGSYALSSRTLSLLRFFFSLVCALETGSETEVGVSEENALTRTDATPTESGPSGLVIFGRLVQKHSYVSGLIIMMVRNSACVRSLKYFDEVVTQLVECFLHRI